MASVIRFSLEKGERKIYRIENNQIIKLPDYFIHFETKEESTTVVFSEEVAKYLEYYKQGKERSDYTFLDQSSNLVSLTKKNDMAIFYPNQYEDIYFQEKLVISILVWHMDQKNLEFFNRVYKEIID
jgi:hypothetical protein